MVEMLIVYRIINIFQLAAAPVDSLTLKLKIK
jgi:hypothetical protein